MRTYVGFGTKNDPIRRVDGKPIDASDIEEAKRRVASFIGSGAPGDPIRHADETSLSLEEVTLYWLSQA